MADTEPGRSWGSPPLPYLRSDSNHTQGQFSSDVRWVAFTSDESGWPEIYVRPFPDAQAGKWTVSTGSGTQPRWRRDGRELFYLSPDRKLMAVEVNTIGRYPSARAFRKRSLRRPLQVLAAGIGGISPVMASESSLIATRARMPRYRSPSC